MARPTKSVNVTSKHLSKEEIENRKQNEDKLKGKADKICPPKYLTSEQKKIFNNIVKELNASNILGNLDVYILEETAISIDRLHYFENIINQDIDKAFDNNITRAIEKYTKTFFRCCNELCLSPQSRAKLSIATFNTEKEAADPLLQALKRFGDNND